jgi:hypothetical protein
VDSPSPTMEHCPASPAISPNWNSEQFVVAIPSELGAWPQPFADQSRTTRPPSARVACRQSARRPDNDQQQSNYLPCPHSKERPFDNGRLRRWPTAKGMHTIPQWMNG